MKFLIAIYRCDPFGGLQRDTIRLIEELAGRGHAVTVFTARWDGPLPPDGVSLEFAPAHKLAANHTRMVKFAEAFRRRLERRDFDVSVAMSRIPGADFYFAADVCMKKYWSKIHSPFVLKLNPRYAAYLRLEREVAAPPSPTRIACIVPGQMRDYAEAYGTPRDRMFLLPPGMNPACRRPPEPEAEAIRAKIRGTLGAAPGDVAVLHISNSVFNKGTDRAIAALGALPENLKRSVRLWIVGKLKESELLPAVESAGLSARTRILGQADGVSEFMFGADLFLHPARNEATGTTLIEAIAAGLPVLTTDACGFASYVREATGTVLDEPYRQEAAVRMLEDMIPRLDDLKRRTLEYAGTQDFCSRAKVFSDILEKR